MANRVRIRSSGAIEPSGLLKTIWLVHSDDSIVAHRCGRPSLTIDILVIMESANSYAASPLSTSLEIYEMKPPRINRSKLVAAISSAAKMYIVENITMGRLEFKSFIIFIVPQQVEYSFTKPVEFAFSVSS